MSDGTPGAVLARCVGDPARFAEQVWGRRSQVHSSGTPATDLLSVEDVDRLVTTSALRLPVLRLVRDGSPLPPASYTTTGTIGGRTYDGVADPDAVLRAMDDGATLVLQGVHRYHPPLARFCRDLELALGHRCQVNAYVTPPGARGLDVHTDPHDVLVLQSFGTKAWEVHPTPWQTEHEPDADTVEQVLEPGDVQYLPRGTPHAARSQQTLSGHVTVGVMATTWADVVRAAVVEATGNRGPSLPVGWHDDAPALAAGLRERIQDVVAGLAEVDTAALVERRVTAFLTSRPRLLAGALLDRQRLADLTDASRLVRRPGSVCAVLPPDDGRVRVLLGDREVTVPAWVGPALDELAGRTELSPSDLAVHLDEQSRLVLCRRLVREGLLAVAP